MRLSQIEISRIKPNPDNPRGIDIETEDDKLSYLKDSISQFGVMVPIVVSQRGDDYLLIDGERRLIAARAVGLRKLPAFILDEDGKLSDEDILFRMFQIHHNRENWGPVQQCKALESVYKRTIRQQKIVSISDERAKIQAITEELVKATGIEERTALDRVYFLRWPKDTKQQLYSHPNEGYWYICEIEEKIIIPALVNYPEYFKKVPADEVRRDLFAKLEAHSVEKSTDVRRVAPFFREEMTRADDKKRIKSVLSQLHKQKEMSYAEAQDELLKIFPDFLKRDPVSPRKMHSLLRALQIAIDEFDVSSIEKAKKRAKATGIEIISAIEELIESLKAFAKQLSGGGK